MSWFEEQIAQRKRQDDEAFARAAAELKAAVTRKKTGAGSDTGAQIKSALDEILIFYGISPGEIPEGIPRIEDRIECACRPHGIMYRTVKLDRGWYRRAVGAMLGTTGDGAPVALIPGPTGAYSYTDPATGRRIRVDRHTQELLEQEATCFYRPFPMKKMELRDLLAYMRRSISPVTVGFIGGTTLAVTLLGLFAPQITRLLFSTVIEEGSPELLLSLSLLFLAVTVSGILMGGIRSILLDRINTEIDLSVEAAAMARVLLLPASFFRGYSAGELSGRVMYIRHLCSSVSTALLSAGLTAVFSLIYIYQISCFTPVLVVPALSITAVTLAFTVVSTRLQTRISRKRMAHRARERGMTYALISGVQKLKLSGSEKRAFSRWMKLYAQGARLSYAPPLFLLLNGTLSTLISLAGTAVLYFTAVKGGVSPSDYYAFATAYGMVSGAFLALSGTAAAVANIRPQWEMVRPILQTLPEVGTERKTVTRLSGSIEFNSVCFRYDDSGPDIIDDFSLKIQAGQYVAIVGKTGCGKSTLVRLLLGFERPRKGAIYYDGRDLNTLDLHAVRRNIGCVMQDGKLFPGDIFSNITVSAPWLNMEDAWRAAELSGIAQDIREMPMGMHTVLTEGSGGISGGQKQRLMIARAVAPSPKILILDEATSALDNITQKQVAKALDGLKCTRIVIAHRLSTIRQCDRIIVMDDGRIVEDGTYDQLMSRGGFFAKLVERQRLDR